MPTLETLNVRVFKNLTRRCYSIQARVAGRWLTVVHATDVLISPATFKVSEAGRQRTLATGKKHVHARVCGSLVAWSGNLAPMQVGRLTGEPLARLYSAAVAPFEVANLSRRLTSEPASLRYRPETCGSFTATTGGCIRETRPVTRAEAVDLFYGGMTAYGAE